MDHFYESRNIDHEGGNIPTIFPSSETLISTTGPLHAPIELPTNRSLRNTNQSTGFDLGYQEHSHALQAESPKVSRGKGNVHSPRNFQYSTFESLSNPSPFPAGAFVSDKLAWSSPSSNISAIDESEPRGIPSQMPEFYIDRGGFRLSEGESWASFPLVRGTTRLVENESNSHVPIFDNVRRESDDEYRKRPHIEDHLSPPLFRTPLKRTVSNHESHTKAYLVTEFEEIYFPEPPSDSDILESIRREKELIDRLDMEHSLSSIAPEIPIIHQLSPDHSDEDLGQEAAQTCHLPSSPYKRDRENQDMVIPTSTPKRRRRGDTNVWNFRTVVDLPYISFTGKDVGNSSKEMEEVEEVRALEDELDTPPTSSHNGLDVDREEFEPGQILQNNPENFKDFFVVAPTNLNDPPGTRSPHSAVRKEISIKLENEASRVNHNVDNSVEPCVLYNKTGKPCPPGCELSHKCCRCGKTEHPFIKCGLESDKRICGGVHGDQLPLRVVCVPWNCFRCKTCTREHQCLICTSSLHPLRQCPFLEERGISLKKLTGEVCTAWNARVDLTCLLATCKLEHICLRCQSEDHPAMLCPDNVMIE